MPSLCESCGLQNQLEEINKKIAEIEAEQFRKEIVKKFKLFQSKSWKHQLAKHVEIVEKNLP